MKRFLYKTDSGDFGSPLYSVLENTEELSSKLDEFAEYPCIAFDTETTGLSFIENEVTMVILFNGVDTLVLDTRKFTKFDWNLLYAFFQKLEGIVVMHNAKFDLKMITASISRGLGKEIDIVIPHTNVYDTMLVERVLHNGKKMKYSLKELAQRYLHKTLDKDITKEFLHIGKRPFQERHIDYGSSDVELLLHIKELQERQFMDEEIENTVILENSMVGIYAAIEYEGIRVDKDYWRALANKKKEEVVQFLDKLDQMLYERKEEFPKYVPNSTQLDMFSTDTRKVNINWNSTQQVTEVFNALVSDSITNVSQRTLSKFSGHEMVSTYVKYKKLQKLLSSYADGLIEKLDDQDRVHTSFSQILNTGRISSANPNMQQIPATNEYRNAFIPNYDDWVFVSADFSSQELCIIATASQDPVWLEALKKGQDLHGVCAELIFKDKWKQAYEPGCPYVERDKSKCESCSGHVKLRDAVKAINFGLAYGMTEHKLSDQLDISIEEAEEMILQFFLTFPKIREYLEEKGQFAVKNGYITTFPPFNRRRYFPEWKGNTTHFYDLGKIARAGKNTPIQGTGADMTKLAMYYIYNYVIENGLPVKMVMTVHDQIDTICPRDYAEEWGSILKRLMEEAATEILENDLLKASVTISERWQK